MRYPRPPTTVASSLASLSKELTLGTETLQSQGLYTTHSIDKNHASVNLKVLNRTALCEMWLRTPPYSVLMNGLSPANVRKCRVGPLSASTCAELSGNWGGRRVSNPLSQISLNAAMT